MKILFFSPYAGLWKHTKIELGLAAQLSREGHEVAFVSCDADLLAPCINMQGHGFTSNISDLERLNICSKCIYHSNIRSETFKFRTFKFNEYLSKEERGVVESIISNVSYENWHDFQYAGVKVGSYAGYEMILNHKLISYEIPKELWESYLQSLRNSLMAIFVVRNVCKVYDFDAIYTYNRLYSTNKSVSDFIETTGKTSISLTAFGPMNKMYSRVLMTSNDTHLTSMNKSVEWFNYRDVPLQNDQVKSVSEHLRALFDAKSPWVYSTKAKNISKDELYERLGITPSNQIILVALSSQDEVFAAESIGVLPSSYGQGDLFATQEDWLRFLHANRNRFKGYHFVIRVHPREFPNKRESVLSRNAVKLKFLAEELSDYNFSFNFPSDQISLYDFIPFVDRVLTSNSSVGVEFSAYAIPVVLHNRNSNTNLPEEILEIAMDKEHYLDLISRSFSIDSLIRKAVFAYRWINFKHYILGAAISPEVSLIRFKVFEYLRKIGSRLPWARRFSIVSMRILLNKSFFGAGYVFENLHDSYPSIQNVSRELKQNDCEVDAVKNVLLTKNSFCAEKQ